MLFGNYIGKADPIGWLNFLGPGMYFLLPFDCTPASEFLSCSSISKNIVGTSVTYPLVQAMLVPFLPWMEVENSFQFPDLTQIFFTWLSWTLRVN